ncbi:MAG: response regulator [Clostridiales bacterium]|nr:response regulator [Clostridiales bacterium]
MINIVLIDDERPALRELEYMLKSINDIQVLGSFVNPIQGIESVSELKPDAVFLDISMPQLSGVDAASIISDRSPETKIVFITAYNRYAVKAFELNALDYLLKPVSQERLETMLDRLKESMINRREAVVALPTLYISRLGGFNVFFEGQSPVEWYSTKAEELFAFLLHNNDEPLSREQIIYTLWPGIDPLIADEHLDDCIYSIRKSLLDYGISTEQVSIDEDCKLILNNVKFDTDSFNESFRRAREHRSAEHYDECLSHYTGKYLEDCGWLWAEEYREVLDRQYISIVFNLVKLRIMSEQAFNTEESDSGMQLDEELIYQYLNRANIKLSNKGFQYCASAIKLATENPQLIIKMEDLYEKVGELYRENAKNVSRAIRYSLTHLNTTNKEFLSRAVYEVQFELNKQ